MSGPRVLFFGTPAFAVPSLEALIRLRDADALELAAVITQPDRPGDRGRITPPPVKAVAERARIPVLQPARLRDEMGRVLALRPDALVWAAYGQIIPKRLIEAVGGQAVNVHASLLPRWRGAAPVAHAILAGDIETGITLMRGAAELDAGPILAQERIAIGPNETAGELEARLAELGARLLEREIVSALAGRLPGREQDPSGVTWAPKLDPRAGRLDVTRPAAELARVVRAFTPDPGAFTTFRGARIGIVRASAADGRTGEPGTFRIEERAPRVATAEGWLRLDEVRPAGKRTMSGADWARGLRAVGAADRMPS